MSIFRAGAAKVDITPLIPVPLAGYPPVHVYEHGPQDHKGYIGRVGLSEGVHDALYARAVAVDDGKNVAVIVALDVCVITVGLMRDVRAAASARWKLDPDSVILVASHNHSGPDYSGLWEEVDPSVEPHLTEMTLAAIGQALARLQIATFGWGEGQLPETAINRRDPNGPIDPVVTVLRIDGLDGEVIATLYCYACHTIVVGPQNRLISTDFSGHSSATVEDALGNGAVALFLNGAAGNINPVAFPYSRKQNISALALRYAREGHPVTFRSHADARRLGRALGGEVLRVLEMVESSPDRQVAFWRRELVAPLKNERDMDEYLSHMPGTPAYEATIRNTDALPTEVAALQLGDLVLLALPGEPFVEIGLALQRPADGSGGPKIRVIGYANDYPGYVLSPEAYADNRYETVATPLSLEGSKAIIDAAQRLRSEILSSGVRT